MSHQYMTDTKGRKVPVELVKDIDKLRDQTVRTIMEQTFDMRNTLRAFKERIWNDLQEFLRISAEQHGVTFGGKKGNIVLTTYDGKFKILIAVNDVLQFNEKLQVAKQIIDELLKEWSENARPEIRALVDHAFAVDKQGNISTERVLGLRKINITDAKWCEAMQAITDSIQIASSKKYMRFYSQKPDGSYEHIPLDVAAL